MTWRTSPEDSRMPSTCSSRDSRNGRLCRSGKVVSDHHVDHAELVFQGDEGDAAGGLWALPADHQAGDPYRSPMSQFRQFAGVAAAAGLELSTQEFQRMRAEGGAEESVIAQQFLAARRQWQADRALFDGGPFGEQRQLRLDAGDGPARLVPVSGETAQGAGIGQQPRARASSLARRPRSCTSRNGSASRTCSIRLASSSRKPRIIRRPRRMAGCAWPNDSRLQSQPLWRTSTGRVCRA